MNKYLKYFCSSISTLSLIGCLSFYYMDFDPKLDKCIGLSISQVDYPPTDIPKLLRIDDQTAYTEYAFTALRNCRWVFVVDLKTNLIIGWFYPDDTATRWCRSIKIRD